jgi:predicted phage terminase large subunit-like protein
MTAEMALQRLKSARERDWHSWHSLMVPERNKVLILFIYMAPQCQECQPLSLAPFGGGGGAADFGRDVRNLIASAEYAALFETTLAEDSQSKGKWHTSAGGLYDSVGIGGSVLGRGAHVMLIDDPFSSMEDALSEATRKNVWDWYTGTAYNRLMPGGAIILINHRMHEDDLAGRLLAQQATGGDRWEVVELPAISEDGSALWPDAYPIEALSRIRQNIQPRFWSALFQQRPAPEEGDFFKSEWLRPYVKSPDLGTLSVYGGSDFAVTASGGDYTVHVVIGIDQEKRPWLLDLWRAQTSSDVWIESLCDIIKRWKPISWAFETGQIKSGVGPFLRKRAIERGCWIDFQEFPTRGDKGVRAQSMRGRMAMLGLQVPTSEPWYPALRAELLSFPAGRHDDQVDALGLVGQLMDKMADGRKLKLEPLEFEPKRDAYRPPTDFLPLDSWKVM